MAVFPSSVALDTTDAYLFLNTTRYTTGGKAIIETIQSAANSATSVTDAEYAEYIQYTHTLYIFAVMYRNLGT